MPRFTLDQLSPEYRAQAVAQIIKPATARTPELSAPKRIRQNSEPVLNKLESEFKDRILSSRHPRIYCQCVRLRLANGVTYTPDFAVFSRFLNGNMCYEVKGPHSWDDALVKLKVAAKEYPEIRFVLAWKQDGRWQEQEVLP